jgi:hypothetical protein
VYLAQNMDVTLEKSHIAGKIEATVTDTLAYRGANLTFANLDTRLLTRLFPTMTFPRPLTLTGKATFDGGEHSLNVNGDVVVDDRLSGRSHLVAVGVMGLSKGVFTARDLHVRMLPLQMNLAKSLAPTLKLNGTMTGTATLNGSSAAIMTAQGDVTEVENGAVSHATGRAAFRARGMPWYDVDANMHPLALATLGRYMPTVGLIGTASGPLKLKGFENNLPRRWVSGSAGNDGSTQQGDRLQPRIQYEDVQRRRLGCKGSTDFAHGCWNGERSRIYSGNDADAARGEGGRVVNRYGFDR